MPINFKDSLDTKMTEIERPKLPPIGTYVFQVTKNPELQENIESKKNNQTWDAVNFQCIAVEATDDVDQDELRDFGALKNISVRQTFMFDKGDDTAFNKSLFRLRRFLEEHLKVADANMPLKQALASSVNGRFLGVLRYRPDQNDPENQYIEIGRTAPVE